MEQVGEKSIDGVTPEKCPPEDACPDEEIDETKKSEIGNRGGKGECSIVVCHQWGCEDGADQGDGNNGDEPHVMDEGIGKET